MRWLEEDLEALRPALVRGLVARAQSALLRPDDASVAASRSVGAAAELAELAWAVAYRLNPIVVPNSLAFDLIAEAQTALAFAHLKEGSPLFAELYDQCGEPERGRVAWEWFVRLARERDLPAAALRALRQLEPHPLAHVQAVWRARKSKAASGA